MIYNDLSYPVAFKGEKEPIGFVVEEFVDTGILKIQYCGWVPSGRGAQYLYMNKIYTRRVTEKELNKLSYGV